MKPSKSLKGTLRRAAGIAFLRISFLLTLLVVSGFAVKVFGQTSLWGITSLGGSFGKGVVFKTNGDSASYEVVTQLSSFETGATPLDAMIQASNGKLYGVMSQGGRSGGGVLFEINPSTGSYTKKIQFAQDTTGGAPACRLLEYAGKLYGTTTLGGATNHGTLFEYDLATGVLTTKVDFDSVSIGSRPAGALALADNGKIYGTTTAGGTLDAGTLFEYDPAADTLVNRFSFSLLGGIRPSGVVKLPNGKLYGTTEVGGLGGWGILYEYDVTTFTYTKLYDFAFETGTRPAGSLHLASNGRLYGVTVFGGSSDAGVFFEYDYVLNNYAVRFNFNFANGQYPFGGVAEVNGKLYGTTFQGGVSSGGVLFEYDLASGILAKTYDFVNATGARPQIALLATKATQTINFAFYDTLTYGDEVTLMGTASSGLRVSYTSSNDSVAVVSGDTLKAVASGNVIITAHQDGNSDYLPATPVEVQITIKPAPLTIKADDKTRPFGAPNPPLTMSFSGFVGTDDETVLPSLPVLSTLADETSPPGTYPITIKFSKEEKQAKKKKKDAAGPAYSYTLVPGTLTVTGAHPNAYVVTPADGAVGINNSSVYVVSGEVPGATAYTIQLSEDPEFSTIDFEQTGPGKTLLFTGLKYGTRYYNRVITDSSSGVPGAVKSFTTRTAESIAYVYAPGNGLENVPVSLNITATEVPGASSYTIQLSESPNFEVIAFENTSSIRTMGFSGLKYNTRYYNRVLTDLSSSPGPVQSFTTKPATALAYVYAPGNGATNVNVSLNITMNEVPGATEYTVQLSEFPDFSVIHFERSAFSRTIPFDGLKYGTRYYNRGYTDLSPDPGPVQSFTTKSAGALSYVYAPGNGTSNVNTSLNITANLVPGASEYTIQLSEFSDFSVIAFEGTSSSRTIPFSGLKYNTRYYNRVTTDLSPSPGQVLSFTTRTSESLTYVYAPGNGATNVNASTNITANLVPGASTYTIQLSETSDFSVIAFESTSSNRTMPFTLAPGTRYYNRVRTDLSPNWGQVKNFRTKGEMSMMMMKEDGSARRRDAFVEPDQDPSTGIVIDVYPNPFVEKLSVYVSSKTTQPVTLSVFDLAGRRVYSTDAMTNTLIDINEPFGKGVYLLSVKTGLVSRVIKVVRKE